MNNDINEEFDRKLTALFSENTVNHEPSLFTNKVKEEIQKERKKQVFFLRVILFFMATFAVITFVFIVPAALSSLESISFSHQNWLPGFGVTELFLICTTIIFSPFYFASMKALRAL